MIMFTSIKCIFQIQVPPYVNLFLLGDLYIIVQCAFNFCRNRLPMTTMLANYRDFSKHATEWIVGRGPFI